VQDVVANYLHDASDTLASLDVWPSMKPTFIKFNTPLPASAACERLFSAAGWVFVPIGEAVFQITGRLHGTIVGPTGRSYPGYVPLSVRPVGHTGRTDCSRTAHICQSNQCGLLANYRPNTAYAAA